MKNLFPVLIAFLSLISRSQTITTCGEPAFLSAAQVSTLNNVSYSIQPGGMLNNSGLFTVQPTASTTFTLFTSGTDINNTFVTVQTQSVVLVGILPSFTVNSSHSFTLGCSSKSTIPIGIISSSNPSPLSYTVFAPGQSIIAQGSLSTAQFVNINAPGVYTTAVINNQFGCSASTDFTVVNNTAAPIIDSISNPYPVLNCSVTSTVLKAFAKNAVFSWQIPGGNQAGPTVTAVANTSMPNSTLNAKYVVTVEDINNYCKSQSTITIMQNLFVPSAKVAPANVILTCHTPTVQISNQSMTGIPVNSPFPRNQPVVAWAWEPFGGFGTSIVAAIPGVYTLTVIDANNYCKSNTTFIVGEAKNYPIIDLSSPAIVCPPISGTLSPKINFNMAATYSWTAPVNAITSALNSPTLITNSTGIYTLEVTGSNGCASSATMMADCTVELYENTAENILVFPTVFDSHISLAGLEIGYPLHIMLCDLSGRIVFKQLVTSDSRIALPDLNRGIYIVIAESRSGVLIRRRIIKN